MLRRVSAIVVFMALLAAGTVVTCTDPDGGGGLPDGSGDTGPGDDGAADVPTDAGDTAADDGGTVSDIPEATRSECERSGRLSYIWIGNSAEGTVSKLCTLDGIEVARYASCPNPGRDCDPSRTSVNLHGDMVVTNRDPGSGPSSVTKIAGKIEDCVDRGGDGIRTSRGPTDVLAWGEDDCVLWNTILPNDSASASIGARATAWDGTENEETGEGGFVWIGAMTNNGVYKLDGDDGTIVARSSVKAMFGPYGGAMDGLGNFWIVGTMCTVGACEVARVNTADPSIIDYFPVTCGYGISVDGYNRVWTSGAVFTGGSCVNRLDPAAPAGERQATLRFPSPVNFFRGLAVDRLGSVWVANTGGQVIQIDQETVTEIIRIETGCSTVVGVAVDVEDKIWAVSQDNDKAIKIDPFSDPLYRVELFDVGDGPYTYSDMTGYQLRTVILY